MVESAHTPPMAAHVMTDDSGSSIAGCGGAVLVGAVVGLIFAASSGSRFFIVILVLVLLVAASGVTWAVLEMRRWEPLELHFSKWPLELGSTTSVDVVRRARQTVADADYNLEAELTCEESARYTVGSNTRTATDTVHRDRIRVDGRLRDRVFHVRFDLVIPHDRGAPTMDLGHNEVEWKLDIDVDELSRLMAKIAFTLEVVPVLDSQHHDVQDTQLGGAR